MEKKETKCPICGNAYVDKDESKERKACPDCRKIVGLADAMASYLGKASGKRFLSEGRSEEEESLLKDVNGCLALIHVGLLPHLEAMERLYDVFYTHELTLDCPPYKVSDVPYLGLRSMHEFVYDEFLSLLKPFLEGPSSLPYIQKALRKPSQMKVYVLDEDGEKASFPRFDVNAELKKASSLLKDTQETLSSCHKWGRDLFTFMGDRYRFKGFEKISLAKIYRAVYALDGVYRAFNLSLSPEATLEFAPAGKIVETILKKAIDASGKREE